MKTLLTFVSVVCINICVFAQSVVERAQEVVDASQTITNSIEDADIATQKLTKQINVLGQTGSVIAHSFYTRVKIGLDKVEEQQDEIQFFANQMASTANLSEIRSLLPLPAQLEGLEDYAQIEAINIREAVSSGDIYAANVGITNLVDILEQMESINSDIYTLATGLVNRVDTRANDIENAANLVLGGVTRGKQVADYLKSILINDDQVDQSELHFFLYEVQEGQSTVEEQHDEIIYFIRDAELVDPTVDSNPIVTRASTIEAIEDDIQNYASDIVDFVYDGDYTSAIQLLNAMEVELMNQRNLANEIKALAAAL